MSILKNGYMMLARRFGGGAVAVRIQMRRDTAANWADANPLLFEGEPGFETDTRFIRVGDGKNAWNDLKRYDPKDYR